MKTLITTLLLIGTFTLVNAAEKKEQKENFEINQTELNQLQNDLLENYLQNDLAEVEINNESKIIIYNEANQVVYSGAETLANDLLEESAYLAEYQDTKTYLILK